MYSIWKDRSAYALLHFILNIVILFMLLDILLWQKNSKLSDFWHYRKDVSGENCKKSPKVIGCAILDYYKTKLLHIVPAAC